MTVAAAWEEEEGLQRSTKEKREVISLKAGLSEEETHAGGLKCFWLVAARQSLAHNTLQACELSMFPQVAMERNVVRYCKLHATVNLV